MYKVKTKYFNTNNEYRIFIHSILKIIQNLLWNIKRNFGNLDKKIIEDYFSQNDIKKLHIGCGKNLLIGWLNSDYFPKNNQVLHLNATSKFPFEDNVFDYIFSEHMIEHISYSNASFMLHECYRILKKNGKIRISTPNIQFLIDLFDKDKSNLKNDYITWSTNTFVKDAPYCNEIFVVNNFVRDWGHIFIYDEKSLKFTLEESGFGCIERFDLNKSHENEFLNLENELRLPSGFLQFETITLEAKKL